MDPVDTTDVRWRWAEALAQLDAHADLAGTPLADFLRNDAGQLLAIADERNTLAATIAQLRALLGGG